MTMTSTTTAMIVSTQVLPVPMENAAPGLRMRSSRRNAPSRSRGGSSVSALTAHHFESWSSP
jgi:hypothetical protein